MPRQWPPSPLASDRPRTDRGEHPPTGPLLRRSVDVPAPAGRQVDAPVDALVAGDVVALQAAELVLVVVHASPGRSRAVVAAEEAVLPADCADQKDRRVRLTGRGH